jgi:hypothetical protein
MQVPVETNCPASSAIPGVAADDRTWIERSWPVTSELRRVKSAGVWAPSLDAAKGVARVVSVAWPGYFAFATVDGTAKAGKDYVAFSGPVTILAGRSSATVTVAVLPNRIVDGNRTLSLKVSSGATTLATGVGTIRDDDRAPRTLSRQTSQFSLAAAFASLAPQTTTKKK